MRKNPSFQIPDYYYIHEKKEAVIAVFDTSCLIRRKETFAQRDILTVNVQVIVFFILRKIDDLLFILSFC